MDTERKPQLTLTTNTTTHYYLEPLEDFSLAWVRERMVTGECWYCEEFVVKVGDGFGAGTVRARVGTEEAEVAKYTTVTRTERKWE